MTTEITELKISNKDWQSHKPTWCPGCGDFGVLSSTRKALVNLQWSPDNTVVVSGIGCSSNFPHFLSAYGIHTLHGRANPVAQGVKMANPDLNVIVAGGDGDGLAIGIGGFVHAARRNMDLTYIIMDNQVYGLTVNQASPTSTLDRKTRSTPYGNIEQPLNPIALALSMGASFVARTFSGEGKQFEAIVQAAMEHKGFAFIDALSPCVTFNRVNTKEYFKERVFDVNERDHDKTDLSAAFAASQGWEEGIPTGIFYQVERPTYESMDETIARSGNVVKRGANHMSVDYRTKVENKHR